MQNFFTAPGGRSSILIKDSNPDPDRRFHISISDNFMIGADGLRDLALFLTDFASAHTPPATSKKKTTTKETKDV